jgi:hypothetical protein
MGSCGNRPVPGQPLPVNTLFPEGQADPGRRPLLEAAVRRTPGIEAHVLERMPWAPGSKDEEAGSHGPTILGAWPVVPQWVGLPQRE